MSEMGSIRYLPELPNFGAIYNPNSTHSRLGEQTLDLFRKAGRLHAACETLANPYDRHQQLVEFMGTKPVDVMLVIGGDGLLNEVARALKESGNKLTALAPSRAAGAGDAKFLTLGDSFDYTPLGFAGQPVVDIYPTATTISHAETGEPHTTIDSLLYTSIGGLVTKAAAGINSRTHRAVLRYAQRMPSPIGKLTQRTAESLVIAKSLGAEGIYVRDSEHSNPRFVSDLIIVNGGRMAGILKTPGELLRPEFQVVESLRRAHLATVAGQLLLGRSTASFTAHTRLERIVQAAGKHGNPSDIAIMYDGETNTIPSPSKVTVTQSPQPIPLVFAREKLADRLPRHLSV